MAVTAATPTPDSGHAPRPGLVLAAVAVAQFLVTMDQSIVNVSLPNIADGLGFGAVGLTWVINAYILTFGGLLLLGGKAADRYGRRQMLLAGLGLFAVASFAGGLAQSPGQLIAARAVQGIGAAALAPAALSLLTATFPTGRARVRAFGIWSAVNAAGGAFGVLVGGLLTEYAGWRCVMFVNAPIAVLAGALTLRGVSSTADEDVTGRGGRPDLAGAALVTAGMTLLVFTIVRTDQYSWTSTTTLATLAASVVLLAGFAVVERVTTRDPLLRLGILRSRSVAGANAFNFVVGAAVASSFYFVSLYLQRVLDTGPAEAGFIFLPWGLGVIAGSMMAVRLGYRLSARTLLISGGLCTAAGFAWFGFISPDGTFLSDVLGPELLASVGFGTCLGPVVSVATAGVAPGEAGAAAALLNSSRQVGGSLGLAALGTAAFHRTGDIVTPTSLNDGYALGLFLDAALLVVSVIIATTVLRTGSSGSRPRQPATVQDASAERPEGAAALAVTVDAGETA
jgi:EmrB/QacA subfamily drug resistance transporter